MAAPEESPTRSPAARRPPHKRNTIDLVVRGPLARADIPGLCERFRLLVAGSDAHLVVCDLDARVDPDAVTVDALARLQLTARRLGRSIRLRDASWALQELIALVGMRDVVPLGAGLRLGTKGQTEEREQGLGVEEGVEPDDPAG